MSRTWCCQPIDSMIRAPQRWCGSAAVLIASIALVIGAALVPAPAVAGDVRPGEYLTEGGWGMLHVARGSHDVTFAIDAEGPNGHQCNVRGRIVADKAVLEESDADRPCEITFVPAGAEGAAVDVVLGAPATCRAYCGLRAGFEGRYARPDAGCRTDRRLASAAIFMKAYRAARYNVALTTLQPVLSRCARWLDAPAQSRLIEDIAITQYHLGRFDDCLATLEPLRAEAERSDAELTAYYHGMPAEIELAHATGAQTRTNLALCGRHVVDR